jgi:anthranilate synthase component 1
MCKVCAVVCGIQGKPRPSETPSAWTSLNKQAGSMDMALGLRTMVIPTANEDSLYAYSGTDSRREWTVHLQVRVCRLRVGVCRRGVGVSALTAAHMQRFTTTLLLLLLLLRVSHQAGAGLVADSVPESEYEETLNKAAALGRAIDLAEQAFVEARCE